MSEEYVGNLGNSDSRKHDHTVSPVGTRKVRSTDFISADTGESKNQIYRYIRLTELIPELLDLVDEGKIGLRPAVELSYIGHRQHDVYDMIEQEQATPTHEQAKRMRRMFDEGKLTREAIEAIMMEPKSNQQERIVLRSSRFNRLFPLLY